MPTPLLLSLTAAVILLASDPPGEPAAPPAETLQGTWALVSSTSRGLRLADGEARRFRLLLRGGKYVAEYRGQVIDEYTYQIDPSTSPARITLTITQGPDQGKSVPGIYRLKGDRLDICRQVVPGGPPPEEFASGKGSGFVWAVFKRAGP